MLLIGRSSQIRAAVQKPDWVASYISSASHSGSHLEDSVPVDAVGEDTGCDAFSGPDDCAGRGWLLPGSDFHVLRGQQLGEVPALHVVGVHADVVGG